MIISLKDMAIDALVNVFCSVCVRAVVGKRGFVYLQHALTDALAAAHLGYNGYSRYSHVL